ncbi:MAG: AAA family ATPase [Paracoccaceae bacterium]
MDYPASITAQTLRALHVELSFGKNERHPEKRQTVVGFTSSVRAEGKTTTALNFATFLAARGESVVLLDLDFLAFNMSRQLRPALAHENKLMELIAGPAEVAPSLEPVPAFPNLYFVGAVSQQPVGAPTPRELEALNRVIEVLREQFDMVIVDLPPLRGVSESQLLANLATRSCSSSTGPRPQRGCRERPAALETAQGQDHRRAFYQGETSQLRILQQERNSRLLRLTQAASAPRCAARLAGTERRRRAAAPVGR